MKKFFLLLISAGFALAITSGSPNAVKGGTMVIGYPDYPKSLLTYLATEELSVGVSGLALESLLEIDSDAYEPIPLLASSYTESKDHKTFTFKLNPAAKFSDGKPVTAEDVKFTWDTIMNPRNKTAPYQSYYESISTCRVVDKMTVEFKVKTLHFKNLIKLGGLAVLPKHVYSKGDFNRNFNQTLVGSGPYTLEEAKVNQKIIMKRDPKYWGASLPQNVGRYNFDRIVFKTVKEYDVQYELFKKGDIDYFYFLVTKTWATQTDGPQYKNNWILKFRPETLATGQTNGMMWNIRKPLFKDVRVRTALSHLFNREKFIKELFYGAYTLTTGIVPVQSDYHAPGNEPLLYNPEKAKQLLKEAGWTQTDSNGVLIKDGKRFEFELLDNNPAAQRYLTIYQEDLKKVGILMKIRIQDWASTIKLMDDREFDALSSARGRDPEPSDFCGTWASKYAEVKGSSNTTGYKNQRVDVLCEKIDESFDKKERIKMIRELDMILAKDQPMSFGWDMNYFRIGHWNKFSYPANKGAYKYSGWKDVFHYWWYDEKKAAALKQAVAKGTALPKE